MPPRPKPNPAALLRQATDALHQSLAGLNLALRHDHPVKDCLPLPELTVPATVADITAYADQVFANLWTDVGKADPWIAAKTTCPHLSPDGVRAVWDVISAWRGLLCAAADHAEGRKQTFGIADCQASLTARLDDLHVIVKGNEPADGSPFGPPIDSYSRADALRDGGLIQADPKLCREVGYPAVHVALTANAWADCVAWTDADNDRTHQPQNETGRLHDVLFMGRFAYRQAHAEASRTREAASAAFSLVRVPRSGPKRLGTHVVLRLHLGPGVDGVPVVTIGQPGDD